MSDAAAAHVGEAHDTLAAFSFEPHVVVGFAIAIVLYARGLTHLWRRAAVGRAVPVWQALAFAAGLLTLAAAVVSPLDALAGQLASMHMVQHMLLMAVAAPLLVAAKPLPVFLAGLPTASAHSLVRAWNRRRLFKAVFMAATRPGVATLSQGAALWLWHAPLFYQAALVDELVHELEHITFFGTALLFWWSALHRGGARGRIVGATMLVATMLHTGLLGALMTFSRLPWYPIYGQSAAAWGLSPVDDQQLAGLIMWVPAGAVYMLGAILLLASWLPQQAAFRRSGSI
jgi:cytochrome c oxidase assembly factor CtaG